ncbi:MAG TPA: AIR carboxylase family protein [Planctomycetota bacterium]|nr:AIR carboxylase family protein [Planctomycetota bacterium]
MGSAADWPTMQQAAALREELGVPPEARVVFTHRTPELPRSHAREAQASGLRAIVAGGDVAQFVWLSDSRLVLHLVDEQVDGTSELFASDPIAAGTSTEFSGTLVLGGQVLEFDPVPWVAWARARRPARWAHNSYASSRGSRGLCRWPGPPTIALRE